MRYTHLLSSNLAKGVILIFLMVVIGILLWVWRDRDNKASDRQEVTSADSNVASPAKNSEVATNQRTGDRAQSETDETERQVNDYYIKLSPDGSSLRIEQGRKLLRTVKGTHLSFPCDTFSANAQKGGRAPVVMVEDYTGGNHCCLTTHYLEFGRTLKVFFEDGSPGCPEGEDPEGDPEFEMPDFTPFDWEYASCCQYRGITTIVSTYRNGKVTFRLDLMKKPAPSVSDLTARADELRSQLSRDSYRGGNGWAFQQAVMQLKDTDTELFSPRASSGTFQGYDTKPDPNFFDVMST